jgi:hypothetical protein
VHPPYFPPSHNTMRQNRSRVRLEPHQPRTFEYNGPIDIIKKGHVCLQVSRLEDLPRDHRLIKYINPNSDTRYYVIDGKNIKGLHFNKEVLVLGLRMTRKGDKITITLLDPQPETQAEFTPAKRRTEPADRLALKEFMDLEARIQSAASNPEALPQIIAIQMELREKYGDLLEQFEIKSVLDRIQGLIVVASGTLQTEPGPATAAQHGTPTAAHPAARRAEGSDPAVAEILSLLHHAMALEKSGDDAQSRKALEAADNQYCVGIDVEADDRKERTGEFAAALEADEDIMRFLRDKTWPLLMLASTQLQEVEARKQEPLARKELAEIRDGFIELIGRDLSARKEIVRAQKDYQALRKREKGIYVEMLMKPYGKYRSVNIWQSEYPDSYRNSMLGLSTLRDAVIINKVKAKKKITVGAVRIE